jgi:hypothetical protein
MAKSRPSLYQFEYLVARGDAKAAFKESLYILLAIETHYGAIDGVDAPPHSGAGLAPDRLQIFSTRFTAAFKQLLFRSDFELSWVQFHQLIYFHRWLELMFYASGFRSSDCLLPLVCGNENGAKITFSRTHALSFLSLYSPNSGFELGPEGIWGKAPRAAATAFLNYVASRYVFRKRAFEFREKLLAFLPTALAEVEIPKSVLAGIAEYFMACSYAVLPQKHAIKTELMRQMRQACLSAGCEEFISAPDNKNASVTNPERPTIVVVVERMSFGHSVYRTHSLTIKALRKKFHVIGVVTKGVPAALNEELFDETILLSPEKHFFPKIKAVSDKIRSKNPTVVYHIGVGMLSEAIALASLRLAPVQCVSFGHTATTMSPAIDYMLLPEDFVSSTKCFSETVIPLSKDTFVFRPMMEDPKNFRREPTSAEDGVVRVAIPASVMKLNPPLFEALAEISKNLETKFEFHFFPLGARGLAHRELSTIVSNQLPNSVVFMESSVDIYMKRLAACDFFLCPFPYGNMNSIIDAVSLGLTGVCLDGDEAHAHADVAIFSRLGFPSALAAKNTEEYVAAARRLISDAKWRKKCLKIASECDIKGAFFEGKPELFADAIEGLIARKRDDVQLEDQALSSV